MAYIYGDQSEFEEGDILHRHKSQWISRGGLAEGDIAGGNANAFAFAWQNPHSNPIIVTRLILDITTAGGTADGELDAGSAPDATTHSDDLIDGVDPNAVAVYDNIDDKGANGQSKVKLDAKGGATDWLTCQILLQNEAALDGRYYIEYIEVLE